MCKKCEDRESKIAEMLKKLKSGKSSMGLDGAVMPVDLSQTDPALVLGLFGESCHSIAQLVIDIAVTNDAEMDKLSEKLAEGLELFKKHTIDNDWTLAEIVATACYIANRASGALVDTIREKERTREQARQSSPTVPNEFSWSDEDENSIKPAEGAFQVNPKKENWN